MSLKAAYIAQLTPLEQKVLQIASSHLETSFSLAKSIGFQEWLAHHQAPQQAQAQQAQAQQAQAQQAQAQQAQAQAQQAQQTQAQAPKMKIKIKKKLTPTLV